MALVSLEEAKQYLRVDSGDEDAMVGIILNSACKLCADVARFSDETFAAVNSDAEEVEGFTAVELSCARELLRIAILYTIGYMFEHREDADHHGLTLTLRALLFSLREGVV